MIVKMRKRQRQGAVAGAAVAGVAAVVALALMAGGSGGSDGSSEQGKDTTATAPRKKPVAHAPAVSATPSWDGKTEVIGDGSTSYTGPQPKQLKPEKLKPGEKPPQFVVFSWDGALENDDHLFSRFRELGERYDAQMTFFLSGIYLLPDAKRKLYHAPLHSAGASAIDFPTEEHIKETLEQLRLAYEDGNEIGTHFNGHFCAPDPGGAKWSTEEWRSEIAQAYSFVQNWKTNTGFTDIPPLPFDYARELAGGRAPCLEGQKNLLPAAKSYGWRYDASSPGEFQVWPAKKNDIWNFPLQLMPFPGKDFQVLSMDFNFLYNQSGGEVTQGDPAKYPQWEKQAVQGYLNGFQRVYNGSRAPLFIGNHFETWNGGIYMQAVEDVMKDVCRRDGVRCVSFKELCDWLDVQDPDVLAKMRNLDPGQSPDWSTFLKK
ncbi:hypothetical protein GCM10009612_73180 [Streptomyces beijiangensis]